MKLFTTPHCFVCIHSWT